MFLKQAHRECDLILQQKGEVKFRIDGADPPELTKQLSDFMRTNPSAQQPQTHASVTPSSSASMKGTLDPALVQRLQTLVNSSPVILFMKGTPEAPQWYVIGNTMMTFHK
jgi:hypothetical protein